MPRVSPRAEQASRAGKTLRYKGTVPFQDLELDRKTFFGRDRESRSLRSLVLAERLVVLFGKSGMGKTSLINAGLVQPLREMGHVPLVVRLADRKRGPLASLLSGVRAAAQEAGIDIVGDDPSSVWSFFKTAEFWSPRDDLLRPVLIVDQFEELFTLHRPELRREFISQLAALVRGRMAGGRDLQAGAETTLDRAPPDLKIVLSMREDFLADLEELAGDIPGILHKRFRLEPLSLDGAREAIVGPAALVDPAFDSFRFSYQEKVVERIISFLARRRHGAEIVRADSVEPVQLQLICHYLEEVVQARQSSAGASDGVEVSDADLGDEAQLQRVLESFYDRTLAAITSRWERRRVRRLCEHRLISGSGRRLTEDEEEIESKHKVSRARLQQLVNSRLLRPEPRLGGIYYELSHDTLVEPIQRSRKKRVLRRRLLTGGVLALLFVTCAGLRLAKQERQLAMQRVQLERQLRLISLASDQEAAAADTTLAAYLERSLREHERESVGQERPFEIELDRYTPEAALWRLLEPAAESSYIARLPAYVFTVAELLGAELDVLGIYRSKFAVENSLRLAEGTEEAGLEREDGSAGYTYQTFFVVNKESMEGRLARRIPNPGLPDLEMYLKSFPPEVPPTFAYHSRLSASSFLLPAAYFRERNIMGVKGASRGSPFVIPIRTEETREDGSKALVRRVSAGDVQLAAVWDGTRMHFESLLSRSGSAPLRDTRDASKVAFIPLEQAVPNDLLVVSRATSSRAREWIRDALEEMQAEDIENDADFLYWRPIDVHETRYASSDLAVLRQLARAQVATPVTVRIDVVEIAGRDRRESRRLQQAAADAVRLSGSELVLWSEYYEHADFDWTLRPTHDDAVVLTSEIGGLERLKQTFQINFKDHKDLTERVADLIRSRLHRIRYVSPYSESDAPTILRDGEFSYPSDGTFQVQKIRWSNRQTNHFVIEKEFPARVVQWDARRFVLSGERFDEGLNPIGSVSYRAVLPRPSARSKSAIIVMLERVKTFLIG